MPVKLNPTSVIQARLGIQPGGAMQAFFTSECAKAMDKFVPYDEGILSEYYIEGNDKIVYEQEYAKYQYYGIRKDGTHAINPENRNRSVHPQATSYWDKHMVTANLPDIIKKVQKKYGGK